MVKIAVIGPNISQLKLILIAIIVLAFVLLMTNQPVQANKCQVCWNWNEITIGEWYCNEGNCIAIEKEKE